MARIPGSDQTLELMVNCKTYPAVSQKYVETVCTGGIQADGQFVRLYPVPFRFLETDEQYERWDVIRVRAYRDTKDTRPESWHLIPGTSIEKIGQITTEKRRWEWMRKAVHTSTAAMEQAGVTNGCVEIEPLKLYWKPDPKEWTAGQLNTINQGDFFATEAQRADLADRVPWQYRLSFREKNTQREDDCKVLAWSYYQGFRRAAKTMTDEMALEQVADKIRSSIFSSARRVFAIFGTHSRFGHWMISALYYVDASIIEADVQRGRSLF
jgi:hypothetical protein